MLRIRPRRPVIEGHVPLPERWVDESIFRMPELTSWAEEHAIEVGLESLVEKYGLEKVVDAVVRMAKKG